MPEICNLYGMSIKLYWLDHLPKHIHILYGGNNIKVSFDGKVISGTLEHDKLNILREWLNKRQDELNDRWEKVMNKQPVERIEP